MDPQITKMKEYLTWMDSFWKIHGTRRDLFEILHSEACKQELNQIMLTFKLDSLKNLVNYGRSLLDTSLNQDLKILDDHGEIYQILYALNVPSRSNSDRISQMLVKIGNLTNPVLFFKSKAYLMHIMYLKQISDEIASIDATKLDQISIIQTQFHSNMQIVKDLKIQHLTDCFAQIQHQFEQGSITRSSWYQCRNKISPMSAVPPQTATNWNNLVIHPKMNINLHDKSLQVSNFLSEHPPKTTPRQEFQVYPIPHPPPINETKFDCPPGRFGVLCEICPNGTWSNDGFLHICSNAPRDIAMYTRTGESTPNCQFECIMDKHYRLGNQCLLPPLGMYPLDKDENHLENCILKDNWTRITGPGTLGDPYSCDFEYKYLFFANYEPSLMKSFTFMFDIMLDGVKSIDRIELVANEVFDISGNIVNSTIEFQIKSPCFNASITSPRYTIPANRSIIFLIYHQESLTISWNQNLDIFWIKIPSFALTRLEFGRFGAFPAILYDYAMYREPKFDLIFGGANKSLPDANGNKCGDRVVTNDGTCACLDGYYETNRVCVICPHQSFSSRLPRLAITDCSCPTGKFMDRQAICQVASPSLPAPEIQIFGTEIQQDIFLVGSKMKILNTHQNSTTKLLILRNKDGMIQTILDKNDFMFATVGEYHILASLEEFGRLSGTPTLKRLQVKTLNKEPIVIPNTTISSPCLLQIVSDQDGIYYNLGGNEPNTPWKPTDLVFVKPGDTLTVQIRSNSPFFQDSNQVFIKYQESNESTPQNPSNYAPMTQWCWLYSTECALLVLMCLFVAICPLLMMIVFAISFGCVKYIQYHRYYRTVPKCSVCNTKASLKCLDCHPKRYFCKSCISEQHHPSNFHRIIGKDNIYMALFDFVPEAHPEISLLKGELVQVWKIHGNGSEDGWWYGTNQAGQIGYFPAEYLEKYIPKRSLVQEFIRY